MPSGMFLKSTALASSISAPVPGFTLHDYCAEAGISSYDLDGGEVPIPVGDFVSYGLWYQRQLVPNVERSRVVKVRSRPEGGFELRLDTGENVSAHVVVVSAGVVPFAYVPDELRLPIAAGAISVDRVSHASAHSDLSCLAGQRVAVVGAGQSALETAVLLNEAGAKVDVIARSPMLQWGAPPPVLGSVGAFERIRKPGSPLGAGWPLFLVTNFARAFRSLPSRVRINLVDSILGPSGAWWLRERFSDEIELRLGKTVQGVDDKGGTLALTLQDGTGTSQELLVDHVVAATGYRVDLTELELLGDVLKRSVATLVGSPVLSPVFESSVPGLFFTGLAAAVTFGPLLRFVAGSNFAAKRVSIGVARRVGLPTTP